ncbi:hypothetical protein [Methylobacter sp.]|uniref:hypothetical protein n=1 Tax=Methylobacter sp. TaxID=2051955 RepID=UPI003DA66782
MNMTYHAATRSQQRGIPPLVMQWLDQFGEEQYDGRGAIIRYFSRASRRAMEREFGSNPVKKMSEFLNVYKVENQDGKVITTGHLTKRIKRK